MAHCNYNGPIGSAAPSGTREAPCSAVKSAYPGGACPDCGESIPDDAPEAYACSNCGHACYSLPNAPREGRAVARTLDADVRQEVTHAER